MFDYTLSNAEELNQENILSFDIPSRDERTSLTYGDTVKLIFDSTERMWVDIIGKTPTGYVGILANIPHEIKTIKWGDDVVFEPENIIAIADENTIRKDVQYESDAEEDNIKLVSKNENTNTPNSVH